MPSLSFQKQFSEAVSTGAKKQTIRTTRKRPIKRGDLLYLYTSMRTKYCRFLCTVACTSVYDIEIRNSSRTSTGMGYKHKKFVYLNNRALSFSEIQAIAVADGFDSVASFFAYFLPKTQKVEDRYKYIPRESFKGQLIKW